MSPLDIDDGVIAKLVAAARDGNDPLGIIENATTDSPESVLTTVLSALEGADADTAARVAAAIPLAYDMRDPGTAWRHHLPLDVLTADLLCGVGIDPLIATWISIHGGGFNIKDADTDDVIAHIDGVYANHPMGGSWCSLGQGVRWRTFGEVRTHDEIPETIAIAARHRLLRDVVTHPDLDRHLLHVMHIGRDDPFTIITTDHIPACASLEELTARGPCGCR